MSWIIAAASAAFLQNLRTLFQKQLTLNLSSTASAFGRFLFAWPFAVLAFIAWIGFGAGQMPTLNGAFFTWLLPAAMTQAGFTFALSRAFRLRNFAVAVTLTKTSVVFVGLLGAILLSEVLSLLQWLSIVISFIGVAALVMHKSKLSVRELLIGLLSPASLWGLLGALLLGCSNVFYRGASVSLDADSLSVALTVALIALSYQVLLFSVWLLIYERDQYVGLLRSGGKGFGIGLTGFVGSACWFYGYTLAPVAYISAVGQIEIIFAAITSALFFKERITAVEFVGLALVGGGVVLFLLG